MDCVVQVMSCSKDSSPQDHKPPQMIRSNINGKPLAQFFTQFLKVIFIVAPVYNTIFNDYYIFYCLFKVLLKFIMQKKPHISATTACSVQKGFSALVAEEVLGPVSIKPLSWWHLSRAAALGGSSARGTNLLSGRGSCLPT